MKLCTQDKVFTLEDLYEVFESLEQRLSVKVIYQETTYGGSWSWHRGPTALAISREALKLINEKIKNNLRGQDGQN